MLRDDRARALAVEFGGQWLDFRRFEEHNAVDRQRFPSFDDELRQAMFEEPVRFFLDVIRQDRSVLDFLHGRHTFVNAVLARHYGMPEPPGQQWVRVDDADRHQRGGILPMAVFLTQNAPGLRTSPVKRGYWVVRRLLGEHIPAPPAQVPDLPSDERKLGNLTLREVLARHRENKSLRRVPRALRFLSGWRSRATARSASCAPSIWVDDRSIPAPRSGRAARREGRAWTACANTCVPDARTTSWTTSVASC